MLLETGKASEQEAEARHSEQRRQDSDAGETGVARIGAGAQTLARQLVGRRGPRALRRRGAAVSAVPTGVPAAAVAVAAGWPVVGLAALCLAGDEAGAFDVVLGAAGLAVLAARLSGLVAEVVVVRAEFLVAGRWAAGLRVLVAAGLVAAGLVLGALVGAEPPDGAGVASTGLVGVGVGVAVLVGVPAFCCACQVW
jgi:hypothetical protein